MTAMRYLLPILFAFLLSACGSDEQGGDVPRKSSEPAVVTREPAANPVVEPPAKAPAPVEESAPKSQPPVPQKATPDKAVERAKAEKPQKVVQAPAKTKLDLSLPPELAAKLEAEDQAAADGLVPILPSFFEEKKPSLNPFQLSGKLITGETGDDYWDSIEGAELQFEFRR